MIGALDEILSAPVYYATAHHKTMYIHAIV